MSTPARYRGCALSSLHVLEWPPDSRAGVPADAGVVVVHDGTPPRGEALARLLDALGDADAVATLDPVTDAVKSIDEDGTVTAVVDRGSLGSIGLPQAVRAAAWVRFAAGGGAPDDTPAQTVLHQGGHVVAVLR